MTVKYATSSFAGFMMMPSVGLAHFTGLADLSCIRWLWLGAFVGANMFQMGFSSLCPAASIMRALGINDTDGAACSA